MRDHCGASSVNDESQGDTVNTQVTLQHQCVPSRHHHQELSEEPGQVPLVVVAGGLEVSG